MKNMFKKSKFGDKFKVRDGRTAIYHMQTGDRYCYIIEGTLSIISCNFKGNIYEDKESSLDIVSKINIIDYDPDKLKKIAEKSWIDNDYIVAILPKKEDDVKEGYLLGFLDGYNESIKNPSKELLLKFKYLCCHSFARALKECPESDKKKRDDIFIRDILENWDK